MKWDDGNLYIYVHTLAHLMRFDNKTKKIYKAKLFKIWVTSLGKMQLGKFFIFTSDRVALECMMKDSKHGWSVWLVGPTKTAHQHSAAEQTLRLNNTYFIRKAPLPWDADNLKERKMSLERILNICVILLFKKLFFNFTSF